MKYLYNIILIFILQIYGQGMIYTQNLIPANHPYIQYSGRWDMSDSLHPRQSWREFLFIPALRAPESRTSRRQYQLL